MSPSAADLFVEAYARTQVPEDRLTELLALLLAGDKRFRSRFCHLVGVPDLLHVDVRTQRRLRTGRRVDLEVILRHDTNVHVVWIEVKAGALEQPNQLKDYSKELDVLYPGRHTLVALAPSGDKIFATAALLRSDGRQLARAISWQMIREQINQSALERAKTGMPWRKSAIDEDASAELRVLAEIDGYLDTNRRVLRLMRDEPLQTTDSLVLSRYRDLIDKGGLVDALLTTAVGLSGVANPERWDWRDYRGYVLPRLAVPAWGPGLNASRAPTLQLWFATTDLEDRPEEPRNQPVVLASLVFDPADEHCRLSVRNSSWPEGVLPHADSTQARLSMTIYLAELATSGVTLASQAEYLWNWAEQAFRRLAQLAPPSLAAGE
jgi:hypothetical protein